MTSKRLYAGTFTRRGNAEGVFWYQFDSTTGALTLEGKANAGPDPAFLTLSADRRFLYTVNEVHQYLGQPGGGVSAFALDAGDGGLKFLNTQPSFGASPCYISLDESGRWVLLANYAGGSVAVYPVLDDGQLGAASEFIQFEGVGVNPKRQEKPHAHSVRMLPNNHAALVTDLGLDEVKVFWLDLRTGKLHLDQEATFHLHPGAGPRHFDFHPNQQWLYVVNELDSTLAVYSMDLNALRFNHLQTVSTLPEGYDGPKWAADIHVHPDGKHLVASNRAHESLAVFAIDSNSGKVTLQSVTPSGGKTPRNFTFDPSGRWLLAAHQDSDTVVVFAFDPITGVLTPAGVEVALPMPVCLEFV